MAVKIFCNDIEILAIKNSIFTDLYNHMSDYIDASDIKLSDDVQKLIFQLYAATHGIGLDIADYLKIKNDVIIFANLIKLTSESYQKTSSGFNMELKVILENFYKSILDYANDLKQ